MNYFPILFLAFISSFSFGQLSESEVLEKRKEHAHELSDSTMGVLDAQEIYDFEGLDKVMEGEFRDDHFNGVGTIVEQLLKVVQPTKAYFGEKGGKPVYCSKCKTNTSVDLINKKCVGCGKRTPKFGIDKELYCVSCNR